MSNMHWQCLKSISCGIFSSIFNSFFWNNNPFTFCLVVKRNKLRAMWHSQNVTFASFCEPVNEVYNSPSELLLDYINRILRWQSFDVKILFSLTDLEGILPSFGGFKGFCEINTVFKRILKTTTILFLLSRGLIVLVMLINSHLQASALLMIGDFPTQSLLHQLSSPREARRPGALRALGLLLADRTPTVGGGKTFWAVSQFFLRKQL